jgi:hypothetical protein
MLDSEVPGGANVYSTERLFGYRREERFGPQVECFLPERLRCLHLPNRQAYSGGPRAQVRWSDGVME